MPTVTVGAPTNRHHHNHPYYPSRPPLVTKTYYSSRARRARPAGVIGGFFLLTCLILGCALLASNFAISAATSSLAGSGLLSVAAISMSASMLATGAAVLIYLAAGAISTVYAGFQTYNSAKPWAEALKDVVYFNRYLDEERSLKSIFTAITAVSVSPFLLIGGLGGLAFKASTTAYRDWSKASLTTSDVPISNFYDSSLQILLATNEKSVPIENKASDIASPDESELRAKDHEIPLLDSRGSEAMYDTINEYTPLLTSTPNSSPSNRSHEDEEYSDENTPGAWYFHT
jgi:hypothetical protein